MTQFVFERRKIQQWLDKLGQHLPHEEVEALAKRLNSGDRLEAMWEAALLQAIADEANFKHEEPLDNGRQPDFSFTISTSEADIQVYGDITTLSDEGINKQNPIDYFMSEVFRLKNKHGLGDLRLDIRVHATREPDTPKGKTRLCLPPKGEIPSVIKTHVLPVLRDLYNNNVIGEKREIVAEGLSMEVLRRSDNDFSSAGYAGYQNVGVAKDSPLFKKLKDKKPQLSGVPADTLNLLVICDGGSHVIKPSLLYSPHTADLNDICREFLEKNASLDMILLIAVNTKPPVPFTPPQFDKEIRPSFFVQQLDRRKEFLTDEVVENLTTRTNHWISTLPNPVMSPDNARRQLNEPLGQTPRGGWKLSGNIVTLPSRRVAELLAGITSPEEWAHDFEGTGVNPNARIAKMIMEGRMITSVNVIPRDDSDDDWLEVTFGEPDAAISPFRAN